ncbi:OLC1v1015368C2 [Oldenlandia corymbosa var. corymbosa]|uniref:OLC1v1015368C2 n=1 Tax=Oldenlandia corymbosa var. corymbosa TaxID=529605 RepID=A0AAV1E6D7_OLDCO|nr:OLC1v1015368C2 [Oldenlandia corymbosa var. corymbosa]
MESGQKSQAKLTRTQSSLLRSSPTVRSSIHSLASLNEITPDQDDYHDLEEQKPHSPPGSARRSTRLVSGPSRFAPVLVLSLLALYSLFVFVNADDIFTSENLLLALILVAVLLFFAQRNRVRIHRSFSFVRQCFDEYGRKFGFSRHQSKPVQWFIGEQPDYDCGGQAQNDLIKLKKKSIKEGVEFYSNGDFYEGEFHQGRCNGSGVYYYFGNGRYEGDWIDGKYDGYGIESWARGSRFRGQYRNGLRHGYGVYRFYTGDAYSGEWFNGQSHGIGMQTCSDGSCYIGEFKNGVKHGIGVYHFRNGDRYAGEYFGDKIHGFGVYHFANGHCYEGSWHEGRKQGYGNYIFRNGDRKCGEWDGGNLKAALPPSSDAVLRAVHVTF